MSLSKTGWGALTQRFRRSQKAARVSWCSLGLSVLGLATTLNTSVFDPLAWTAIAWLLVEAEQLELPAADDVPALGRIWCKVFQPCGRQTDFLDAWHRHIDQVSQVA